MILFAIYCFKKVKFKLKKKERFISKFKSQRVFVLRFQDAVLKSIENKKRQRKLSFAQTFFD